MPQDLSAVSWPVRLSLHRSRGWLDGMTYALLADGWREA